METVSVRKVSVADEASAACVLDDVTDGECASRDEGVVCASPTASTQETEDDAAFFAFMEAESHRLDNTYPSYST